MTMVGTGSEMNGGAVITNREQKLKIGHVFGDNVMPKFAVLNPRVTFTLPKRQMAATAPVLPFRIRRTIKQDPILCGRRHGRSTPLLRRGKLLTGWCICSVSPQVPTLMLRMA